MIYPYNWKTTPVFHISKKEKAEWKKRPDTLHSFMKGYPATDENGSKIHSAPSYYGIELEMEQIKKPDLWVERITDNRQDEISDLGMYCKADGSLGKADNGQRSIGFEIVSHPRTYASWCEISNKFKDLLRLFREDGLRSRDTGRCGIHFHTNLTSFANTFHAVKWGTFFHMNAAFFHTISKRSDASSMKYAWFARHPLQWASTILKSMHGGKRNLTVARDMAGGQDMLLEHHTGVALTKTTMEVRFFRGTMNITSILRIIRMLEHLKDYTLVHGFNDLQIQKFFEWVVANKKDTKLVNHFMGLAKKTKIVPYPTHCKSRLLKISKETMADVISKLNGEEVEKRELVAYLNGSKPLTFAHWVKWAERDWLRAPACVKETVYSNVSRVQKIKGEIGKGWEWRRIDRNLARDPANGQVLDAHHYLSMLYTNKLGEQWTTRLQDGREIRLCGPWPVGDNPMAGILHALVPTKNKNQQVPEPLVVADPAAGVRFVDPLDEALDNLAVDPELWDEPRRPAMAAGIQLGDVTNDGVWIARDRGEGLVWTRTTQAQRGRWLRGEPAIEDPIPALLRQAVNIARPFPAAPPPMENNTNVGDITPNGVWIAHLDLNGDLRWKRTNAAQRRQWTREQQAAQVRLAQAIHPPHLEDFGWREQQARAHEQPLNENLQAIENIRQRIQLAPDVVAQPQLDVAQERPPLVLGGFQWARQEIPEWIVNAVAADPNRR